MPEELKARILKVENLIEYQKGAVVSKEILRNAIERFKMILAMIRS